MENSKINQDACDTNSINENCVVKSKVDVISPENMPENKKEIPPINDLMSQTGKKVYSDCVNGFKELSLKNCKNTAPQPILQEEYIQNGGHGDSSLKAFDPTLENGEDFESDYEDAESGQAFDGSDEVAKRKLYHTSKMDEAARIKAVSTVFPKNAVLKEIAMGEVADISLIKTYKKASAPDDLIPQPASDIFFTHDQAEFEPKDKETELQASNKNVFGSAKQILELRKDDKPIHPDGSHHDCGQKQVSNIRGTKSVEKAEIFTNTLTKNSDESRIEFLNRKTTNAKNMAVIQAKGMPINIENKSDTNSPIVPSDETVNKIVANIESYFIDFNILKNNFLLKHIRKNKEGFVSLKLITSFRKIRNLTKDWRVVAQCLAKSKMLELNADRNKVRRIQPIPKIEDTSFGKTIVVFNLPPQYGTKDQLKELFEKFGKVVSVDIMTTKSKNFNLYHKRCLSYNQNAASKCFGVVEFDKYESVKKTLKDEEGYLLKENTMSVVTLVAKFYKPKPKANKNIPYSYNSFYPSQDSSRTYFAKRDYPRDNYNSYNMRYNAYGVNDEMYRRKFPYEANGNQWYFRRLAATKNYSKESDPAYKSKANTLEQKCANCGRVPEMWHQNRQLKTNTSFNIERHVSYSGRRA